MLNTPSELSHDLPVTEESDLNETTDELETVAETEEIEGEQDEAEDAEETSYQIGDIEITPKRLKELQASEFRQSDYTRKMQAVANEKKTASAQTESALAALSAIEQILDEDEKTIDWDYLSTSEVKATEAKFKARRDAINAAKTAQSGTKEAITKERIAAENEKLTAAYPEWSGKGGEAKRKADNELAMQYAQSIGHDNESFGRYTDHRDFIMLLDAAKYRALKKSNPATTRQVKQAPKSLKSNQNTPAKPKTLADKFYGKKG